MMGYRSPQPSKEAWESWKGKIKCLYLSENKTCSEIKAVLDQEGFHVSERQIKNRFSEWNLERKKTPGKHYLAMMVIAEWFRKQGHEVVFEVPKRDKRMPYTRQRVKKECERVRKRLSKEKESWILPSLEEAQQTLEEAEITWPRFSVVQHSAGQVFMPHWDGSNDYVGHDDGPMPHDIHPIPDSDTCINSLASPRFSVASMPEAGLFPFSNQWSDHSPYCRSPSDDTSPTIYTPNSARATRCFPPCKSESLPVSPVPRHIPSIGLCDSNSLLSYAPPLGNPCDHRGGFEPHPSDRINVAMYPDYKPRPSPSVMCQSCDSPHKHVDFDYSGMMASMGDQPPNAVEPDHSYTFPDQPSAGRGCEAETHKLEAIRWAAPYYEQCVLNKGEDFLARAKLKSMAALEHAIKNNNDYILPCLSWSILILGQTQRKHQLADLLKDSCELIDQHWPDSINHTSILFHYAWAWARDDEEQIQRFGDRLGRAYDVIRLLWGATHANCFVSVFLFAWHLLRNSKYTDAIALLKQNLPLCESTMGRHDLLTISCLTMAARAMEEMGSFKEARWHLRKAMESVHLLEKQETPYFQIHRPILQRFRLRLLARHANLDWYIEDSCVDGIEAQFRTVLNARIYICGTHVDTWHAANDLQKLLEQTGRPEEAERLKHEMRCWVDLQQRQRKMRCQEEPTSPVST
jgi:hypothetical protein